MYWDTIASLAGTVSNQRKMVNDQSNTPKKETVLTKVANILLLGRNNPSK